MNSAYTNSYAAPSTLINNTVLRSSLNKYQGLNFAVLNTRSILHKMDEIKVLIHGVKLDVLCFVETWLSASYP